MLIVLIIVEVIILILLYKNLKTYSMRNKIIRAICKYNIDQINSDVYLYDEILYDCMESYGKTLFRIFDFDEKSIVPKDVYEKIELYL